jgi:hypothetical protein
MNSRLVVSSETISRIYTVAQSSALLNPFGNPVDLQTVENLCSVRPKHLQRIQESTASNAQQDYADGVVPEVPRNSAAMTDVGHD